MVITVNIYMVEKRQHRTNELGDRVLVKVTSKKKKSQFLSENEAFAGTSLVVQGLRLNAPSAEGPGFNP